MATMAKYQLGDHDFLHSSEGMVYPAHSVQEFPEDLEPSFTWTPLNPAADRALKALEQKKLKQAKEAKEVKDAGLPVFQRKELASEPRAVEAPKPEQPMSMSEMAKGKHLSHADEAHKGAAHGKRHADKDI